MNLNMWVFDKKNQVVHYITNSIYQQEIIEQIDHAFEVNYPTKFPEYFSRMVVHTKDCIIIDEDTADLYKALYGKKIGRD